MDDSQHFVLENSLNGLYECLDTVEREFLELSRRSRPSKKTKPVWNQHQIFEANLKALGDKWSQNLKGIFEFLTDLPTYEKITSDIFKLTRLAKTRYKINEEDYGEVLKSIAISVVAMIMDEEEVSKKSAEIQARRLYFLDQLMTLNTNVENSIDNDYDEDDIEIDVVSISTQNGTQAPTSTTCDEYTNSTSTNNSQLAESLCKLDSIYILDVLFEALTRHTKQVGFREANLQAQIYHIINITYIVDVLRRYLETLRVRIQTARSFGQAPFNDSVLAQLRIAMQKYESSLMKNLEVMSLENPLIIFRMDLRKIYLQVRLLLPWLK